MRLYDSLRAHQAHQNKPWASGAVQGLVELGYGFNSARMAEARIPGDDAQQLAFLIF